MDMNMHKHMQVTVRFFAIFRERLGQASRRLDVAPGATVASLWEQIAADHADLHPLLASTRFAVNGVYATPDTALHEGDEVAFLPPMSGGRM